MSNLGILIETDNDGVKEANYGVITAARGDGDNELYAFVLDTPAEAYKSDLQAYGVQKIVEFTAESGDMRSNPGLQADALSAAINHFDLTAFFWAEQCQRPGFTGQNSSVFGCPLSAGLCGNRSVRKNRDQISFFWKNSGHYQD